MHAAGANYGASPPGRQFDEEQVDFTGQQQILDMQQNDEIVISAAMQQGPAVNNQRIAQ